MRRRSAMILGLFLLAWGPRLLCLGVGNESIVSWEARSFRDSLDYKALACSLSHGHGYALDAEVSEPTGSNRAPLYPFLLSWVVPRDLDGPWILARALGTGLGACIAMVCFLLGRDMRGQSSGWIAYGIMSLYPLGILYALFLLTETLFTLLVALTAWLWLRERRSGSWPGALALGVCLGLGALTRPILLPIAFFCALDILLLSHRARRAGMILLACSACVVPYLLWLRAEYGEWIPITTEGGRSFYQGNNPMNTSGGAIAGVDYDYPAWTEGMSEPEASKALFKEGLRYVAERPGLFLQRAVQKGIRLWSVFPSQGSGLRQTWMKALNAFIDGPFLLFAALGLWVGRRRLKSELPLVFLVLYTTLFCVIFTGSQRFRLPLTPILAIWAAGGVEWMWRKLFR